MLKDHTFASFAWVTEKTLGRSMIPQKCGSGNGCA
jgi:hypothetical protein